MPSPVGQPAGLLPVTGRVPAPSFVLEGDKGLSVLGRVEGYRSVPGPVVIMVRFGVGVKCKGDSLGTVEIKDGQWRERVKSLDLGRG